MVLRRPLEMCIRDRTKGYIRIGRNHMYGLGKFNYDLLFVNSGSAYDSEAFGYYEGRFNIAVYSYNIIARCV